MSVITVSCPKCSHLASLLAIKMLKKGEQYTCVMCKKIFEVDEKIIEDLNDPHETVPLWE